MAKFELLRSIQQKGETILPGTSEKPVFVDISDDEVRELERRGVGKRVREKAAASGEGQGSGTGNGQGSGNDTGGGQGSGTGKSAGTK